MNASEELRAAETKLRDETRQIADRIKSAREKLANEERRRRIDKEFNALKGRVTDLGRKLNGYQIQPARRAPHFNEPLGADSAHLFFCGFLEGDFSERSYLPLPIV